MLVLLVLLALSVANQSSWQLTAEGLGPIRIGLREGEVAGLLGHKLTDALGVSGDDQACHEAYMPSMPGIFFLFEHDKLTRLTLSGPSNIRTRDGFGIGTSEQELRLHYRARLQAYPREYEEGRSLLLWETPGKRGLRFLTDERRRVQLIYAGASSIEYIEGCL